MTMSWHSWSSWNGDCNSEDKLSETSRSKDKEDHCIRQRRLSERTDITVIPEIEENKYITVLTDIHWTHNGANLTLRHRLSHPNFEEFMTIRLEYRRQVTQINLSHVKLTWNTNRSLEIWVKVYSNTEGEYYREVTRSGSEMWVTNSSKLFFTGLRKHKISEIRGEANIATAGPE